MGKTAQVEPNSGLMLPMVARLASGTAATPSPWNSTNAPTTPCRRSSSVMVRTTSVAVAPGGISPVSRKPTTLGMSIETGWPSIAASASIPPTPQPRTPSPLTMVVCESVPTQVSGKARRTAPLGAPASSTSRVITTRARYSRLTWCTMPVPGGTTRNPSKAVWPQRRNWYRSRLRRYSISMFRSRASRLPKTSTITEWSMTSSAGASGLIRSGSPPSEATASRMVARSTTQGTPVKSCMITRAGVNWISVSGRAAGSQEASALMWSAVTLAPSSVRSRFSSSTRSENGRSSAPSTADRRNTS